MTHSIPLVTIILATALVALITAMGPSRSALPPQERGVVGEELTPPRPYDGPLGRYNMRVMPSDPDATQFERLSGIRGARMDPAAGLVLWPVCVDNGQTYEGPCPY